MYRDMQDMQHSRRDVKDSLEDALYACPNVADVQAMEGQCKESSQVCKRAQTMKLSEGFIQLPHLLRNLQDMRPVEQAGVTGQHEETHAGLVVSFALLLLELVPLEHGPIDK